MPPAWRGVLTSVSLALLIIFAGSACCAGAPPAFACVQPEAAIALSDPDLLDRHSADWIAHQRRSGGCFKIQPDLQWEPISSAGGLMLMRRTPPEPGIPPLYFLPASMPLASRSSAPARPTDWLQPAKPEAAEPISPASLPELPLFALPAVSLPSVSLAAAVKELAQAASPLPASVSRPTWQRGYALGFALAVLLVTLWVACIVLLARSLLRRPVKIATPPIADMLSVRQPISPVIHTTLIRPISRPVVQAREAVRPLVTTSAGWLEEDELDMPQRCALLLRRAGWDATVHASPGNSRADVVARRHGRVLALRCLPIAVTLDDEAVEDACMARERERADLAAIVSETSGTADARKLAAQTGIELLRQAGLRDFAR